MPKKQTSVRKNAGRFYTPSFIVANVLDLAGYVGSGILKKSIIDNSCGDGAFLTEIVDRYCAEAVRQNLPIDEIKQDLEKYIFGIEIDSIECNKCIHNLDTIAQKFNIIDVKWNVICNNTLHVKNYDAKMDFVVGNPPYVRVHNLEDLDEIKHFQFSQNGMTDLYIVFFEIGINMLKSNGMLAYITPSSYFNSLAGKVMRHYILRSSLLTKIVDLKHHQVFDATTYNAITVLSKNYGKDSVEYYGYSIEKGKPVFVDFLSQEDFFIQENFYFGKREELKKLSAILNYAPIMPWHKIEVKNGFATLYDDFFIQDTFPFNEYVIPIVKSSTGKWKKCFFPYENGQLVDLKKLCEIPQIKMWYERHIGTLKGRDVDKACKWWGFGRSQAIRDVYRLRYSINSLVRTKKDVKLIQCSKGIGTYSGLYIMTDISFERLKDILVSDEFIDYVSMLSKYKKGGFYTFSSKDLKRFLEYNASFL